MYLVLFSIVLYRTIVTVYTDNIFLYNNLWYMHQINLSLVGCFSRGKPVQGYGQISTAERFPHDHLHLVALHKPDESLGRLTQ